MDINQMKYYIQVYEDKKISLAARNSYVSQQYMSRVVQRFEAEFQTVLFQRTQKGLLPTPAGEKVYHSFKKIIACYQDLQVDLQKTCHSELSGSLRVVLDIGLVQLITPNPFLSFSDSYPQITPGLEEHRIFNCRKMISKESADLAISLYTGWKKEFPSIEIMEPQMVILAHKNHPLTKKSKLTVTDLIHEPLLFSGCPSYYTILQEFEMIQKKANIPIAINELNSIYKYITKGFGVSPFVINPREMGSGHGLPDLPDDIVSIPYTTVEPLRIYAYWKEKSSNEILSRMYAQYLRDEMNSSKKSL